MTNQFPINVPHLTTAFKGPLHQLEQHLLDHQVGIECWLREHGRTLPLLFYSSVDLRNAGFKLAPVDTNLFPAGFNNLNPDFLPLCIQAVQATIEQFDPTATEILLIPESHTSLFHYFENLAALKEILVKAGYFVRVGSLLEELKTPRLVDLPSGKQITIEPLQRQGNRLYVGDFSPDLIVLNNDLSNGTPPMLVGLEQQIVPPLTIGWSTRSKTHHFLHYKNISREFAEHFGIDPWLIAPLYRFCGEVDFLQGDGMECLVENTQALFQDIEERYQKYGIEHPPFVIMKADAGTYGMAVMTIKHPDDIKHLNRKQRLNMAHTKGGKPVSKVLLQEGVYTFETWGKEHAVAEPVVYMIGRHVVGGFYRVHSTRGVDENLNAPGMNFQPLAFVDACNNPCHPPEACNNRFYAYGVIARLAMLAASMELREAMQKKMSHSHR